MGFSVQMFLLGLIAHIVILEGCYIQNCPMSELFLKHGLVGKRGFEDSRIKECPRCGPDENGQCIGPAVCCWSTGCLFGKSAENYCRREQETPTPCSIPLPTCRTVQYGVCTTDSLCCNSEQCEMSPDCGLNQKLHELLKRFQRIQQQY